MADALMHVSEEVRQRVLDEVHAAPEHGAAIAAALAVALQGKKDLPGHQSLPGALASLGQLDLRTTTAATSSITPRSPSGNSSSSGGSSGMAPELQAALVAVFVDHLCSDVAAVQAAALDGLRRLGLADFATLHLLDLIERLHRTERVAAYLLGLGRIDSPAPTVADGLSFLLCCSIVSPFCSLYGRVILQVLTQVLGWLPFLSTTPPALRR